MAEAERPEWLPEWVWSWVPARVKSLMADRAVRPLPGTVEKLTMFDVGGPASRWAWIAFLAFWSSHLAFPFFVYAVSSCPSHARTPLEAAIPWWIRAAVVPSLLTAMYAEWRCFTFVAVPLLQWLGQLDLPRVKRPSFTIWLFFSTLQSVVGRLSATATGVFVGSAWRRRSCDGLDEQWVQLMLILNVAVLSLRVLLSIALALPVGPSREMEGLPARAARYRVDYDFQGMKDGYSVPFMCWDMWHADALKVLADGTNMALVSKHLTIQQNKRAKAALEAAVPDPNRCFQILRQQMRREVPVYFLAVLSMGVQLETQSKLFAWGRATFHARHTPGSPGDGSLLRSIFLGVLAAALNMYGAGAKLSSTQEVANSFVWPAEEANSLPTARSDWRAIVRFSVYLVALIIASFAIVVHSLVRVLQAYRLEDSVPVYLASNGTNVWHA